MEDFSPAGAGLLLPVPLEADTVVKISGNGDDFEGLVRYCSIGPEGYLVGIQFRTPAKTVGNPRFYQPEHLLDISAGVFLRTKAASQGARHH